MIEEVYSNKIKAYSETLLFQKKKLNQIMWGRVIAFLSILLIVGLAITYSKSEALWGIIVPILVFGFLVKKNATEQDKYKLLENLLLLNEQEQASLNGNYSSFGEGKQFSNSDHAFSHDLDLFGKKSLFQFLNRTSSPFSEEILANYLAEFEVYNEEIKNRQLAAEELSKKLDWRQLLRAKGLLYPVHNKNLDSLFDWKKEEIPFFENQNLMKSISWLVPGIMIAGIILTSLSIISASVFIFLLALPFSILGKKLKTINKQTNKLSVHLDVLTQQQELTSLIEQENFESEILQQLQSNLKSDNTTASYEISKLARIGQQLDNRSNALFAIVMNALFLWDLQYLFQLKNWLNDNENKIEGWFNTVHKFEAISSFANFNYNHPTYSLPILSDKTVLKAKDLGHPLLPSNTRVTSDFDLHDLNQFTIITGANMAGKSTFLRAVGINLVLATVGAKVCSSSFTFRPTPLFSSMRTSDSLSENESYFYSELKRLQMIVEKLKSGEKLFVILDEILKGTNSKDKAEGSKKFVSQLIKHPVAGIIATHDLSLCSLSDEYPSNIKNHYFDVELENDELVFDYKLKEGICSNMNAAYLMKKMGITE